MSGRALVLRGDARALPLPGASVDLVVTSPPYWSLRSYTDNGSHYQGQIGCEPTWQEYLDNLIRCTREWIRVLKPSGSLFVNLGDVYSRAGGVDRKERGSQVGDPGSPAAPRLVRKASSAIPEKSLMDLPWRYSIRCVDELGLIKRAEILWSKVNGLPESVTDRVRRSHEVFLHLTRQPRYYSAVDEIREPHAPWRPSGRNALAGQQTIRARGQSDPDKLNPLGKLPGSVWEIATEPLTVPDHLGVDHFAAFPTEWPRRIILGWSPSGICVECGEGRRPVTHNDPIPGWVRGTPATRQMGTPNPRPAAAEKTGARVNIASRVTITGEACACAGSTAPTRPSVILDPFGGTGTSALVAAALGRIGITVDRSADYCRLAAWRTTDPGQLAKAMRVDAPPREHEDQIALFEREVAANA